MNPELQKIENYLISLKFSQKTFTVLSKSKGGKSLVTDNNTAFHFDEISDSFYKIKLSSADSLLLKDNLYLIEFKRVISQLKSKSKRKQIKLRIFQKMAESFHTLRESIFKNSNANPNNFKKHFIIVTEDAVSAYVAASNRLAKNNVLATGNIYNQSFDKYRQQYGNDSKRVYYDSVEIWSKAVFPTRVMQLK
jgi:thiaminase